MNERFGQYPTLVAACVVLGVLVAPSAYSAQIPPFFINSVVALGGIQLKQTPGLPDRLEWQTAGTGFFYGYLVEKDSDPAKQKYETYLVTAKHVVQPLLAEKKDIKVRINPKEKTTKVQEFPVPTTPKAGESTWFFHPDSSIDIAIVQVNLNFLKESGYEPNFFTNDKATLKRQQLIEAEVAAGEEIYVLGFPMNLAGMQRNYVIVRHGIIARISEMLERESISFMIDSFVFPGNSGGPVVLKPSVISIQGTKPPPPAALIGVVTSYRPYVDVAISPQTNRPRISFEENSGLADVLPTDFVEEAIQAWRKSLGRDDIETTSAIPREKK